MSLELQSYRVEISFCCLVFGERERERESCTSVLKARLGSVKLESTMS